MVKLLFLKTDADFANFRNSKSFQNRLLKIRIHYSQGQNTTRFGFIIPKKVLPRVVDRNLLKRRIKSVLAEANPKLRAAEIVFYPNKELVKRTFAELKLEVLDLFNKAKLWKS